MAFAPIIYFDSSKFDRGRHCIFAHSRPDKIGTSEDFASLFFMKNVFDYRQNKPLKHNACLLSIYESDSDRLMSLKPTLLIGFFT